MKAIILPSIFAALAFAAYAPLRSVDPVRIPEAKPAEEIDLGAGSAGAVHNASAQQSDDKVADAVSPGNSDSSSGVYGDDSNQAPTPGETLSALNTPPGATRSSSSLVDSSRPGKQGGSGGSGGGAGAAGGGFGGGGFAGGSGPDAKRQNPNQPKGETPAIIDGGIAGNLLGIEPHTPNGNAGNPPPSGNFETVTGGTLASLAAPESSKGGLGNDEQGSSFKDSPGHSSESGDTGPRTTFASREKDTSVVEFDQSAPGGSLDDLGRDAPDQLLASTDFIPVPEPSTYGMIAAASLVALASVKRWRDRSAKRKSEAA